MPHNSSQIRPGDRLPAKKASAAGEGADFVVVGEAPERVLGKHPGAVHNDLEGAAMAFDQGDVGVRANLQQQVPRTEGARFVVSTDAIFDIDLHLMPFNSNPDHSQYCSTYSNGPSTLTKSTRCSLIARLPLTRSRSWR